MGLKNRIDELERRLSGVGPRSPKKRWRWENDGIPVPVLVDVKLRADGEMTSETKAEIERIEAEGRRVILVMPSKGRSEEMKAREEQ